MTRLYNNVVSGRLIRIKNKTHYLRQNLLGLLCIFLFGFLSGNLFGTILNNLRNWVKWDGFIIFGLIAKIETISYFSYKSTVFDLRTSTKLTRLRSFSFVSNLSGIRDHTDTFEKKTLLQQKSAKEGRVLWNNLNLFKIGIMVGFFVDAFKVGS